MADNKKEEIIRNGKAESESVRLNKPVSDLINLNNSHQEAEKKKKEELSTTAASLINNNIRKSAARIKLLEKEYDELLANKDKHESPVADQKLKGIRKDIETETVKLDKLYRQRELTLRPDKKEREKDLAEYHNFLKKAGGYSKGNADTFIKKEKEVSDKEKKLEESGESLVSKSRSNYRNIRNNLKTKIKPVSYFNSASNKASSAIRSSAKKAGAHALNIIKKLFTFLFGTPPGRIIVLLLIVIGITVGISTSVEPVLKEQYNNQVQSEMVEYKVWNSFFNNSENTDKFYKQYHSYVSGSSLSPIIYNFRNYKEYEEIVQKYYDSLNLSDYDSPEEYEEDVYKNAVEEYASAFDVYESRELFLDHLEYNYTYLKREWSEFEEIKPETLYTDTVPVGGSKDKYINDAVNSEEERLEAEAAEHDEHLESNTVLTEIIVSYEVEDYGYVSKYDPLTKKEYQSYEVTGSHTEEETEYAYVKSYKYRDVISESWTSDITEAEKDVERSSLREGLNDTALYDYWSDRVMENGISKPWEYHYINNGIIVKRIRHWVLKNYKEVYEDLVYKYNPETEYEEYEGDTFTLTIKDDVYGEVTFEIDKTKIFVEYYKADSDNLIYKENLFTEEKLERYLEDLEAWHQIFVVSLSSDINGYPDFDNAEVWRAYNDAELTGSNEYSYTLYGQCTWFVEGLFFQNYGYPMGFTANGNEIANKLAEYWPDNFELSSTPVAGAVFSCGLGSGEGHTGMVIGETDDGNYIISHGNMNGISDPWDVAITDWRIEEVSIEWFSFLGDYEFANPIS